MLQSIRDKTHGWIAGIIISILILSFALWGIHSYFMGGSVSDVAAEVNGTQISQSEFSNAYQRVQRQIELQNGSTDALAESQKQLKEQTLKSLINLEVLKQASLKQDYRISQAQIENYLENMPDFKVDGHFSVARFQQILNAILYSTRDFLELIKTTLLIDQPRLGIIFSSFSLPDEVSQSINLINQERTFTYTVLPFSAYTNQAAPIDDEMIKQYYQSHLQQFQKPELVSLEYLQVSAKELMSKISISDAALHDYYNQNADSFNTPPKWKLMSIALPLELKADAATTKAVEDKAEAIYQALASGSDINTVAKNNAIKTSQIVTRDYATLNELPQAVQPMIATVTEVGKVINPIKVNNEVVIIKVIGYQKPERQLFDKVKDQIKEAIIIPKSEEELASLREKLANITYEHPDSLQTAATELHLPIQSTDSFSKDQGAGGITDHFKIRQVAFSADVLDGKNNSDVIQLNPDTIIVLRVKTHTPASVAPLSEVKAQIVKQLEVKRVDEQVAKIANEIAKQLNTGTKTNEIEKQYHVMWKDSGMMNRHSTKIDSAILDAAFDLSSPANGREQYAVAKVPNGYAVIGLKSIKPGVLARPDDYDAFAEQLQNTQGLLEYELYKQSLIKQAKIVVK